MRAALLLAALALAAPSAAAAQARQQATVLMSENDEERRFQEEWGYADAIVAGDTIYLSGIVAGQREGETLEAAYERTYARIGAVLRRAGASWDDVVDITTFHTDLAAHTDGFVAVKNNYVKAPFPAWTAIGVSRLYEPTAVVEIKVVAVKTRR